MPRAFLFTRDGGPRGSGCGGVATAHHDTLVAWHTWGHFDAAEATLRIPVKTTGIRSAAD
jgi:hypothetical protein